METNHRSSCISLFLLLILAVFPLTTFANTTDDRSDQGKENSLLEFQDEIRKFCAQTECKTCKSLISKLEDPERIKRKFSTKDLLHHLNTEIAQIKDNERINEQHLPVKDMIQKRQDRDQIKEKRDTETSTYDKEQNEYPNTGVHTEYFYDHPIDAFSAIHSFRGVKTGPDDHNENEETLSTNNVFQENEPLASIRFLLNAHKRSPAFASWGGKRTAFASWGGKKGDTPAKFSSWGGKRNYNLEESHENLDTDEEKRAGFNSWGGKRAKFQSWGGKRNGDVDVESINDIDDNDSRLEKRKFQSWGGKRDVEELFQGLSSPEILPDAMKKSSFNSWGGKRQLFHNLFHRYQKGNWYPRSNLNKFLNWGGKRKFSSWGGKRSEPSDEEYHSMEKRGILRPYKKLWSQKDGRVGTHGFSSWAGKRDSSQGFHSWGGKRNFEKEYPQEELISSHNQSNPFGCSTQSCLNERIQNVEHEDILNTLEDDTEQNHHIYSNKYKRSIDGNGKVGLLAAAALLSDTRKPVGLSVGIYNRRRAEFFPWAGKRGE